MSTRKNNLTMAPGGYTILIEKKPDNPAKTENYNDLALGLEKPELERNFKFNTGEYGDSQ